MRTHAPPHPRLFFLCRTPAAEPERPGALPGRRDKQGEVDFNHFSQWWGQKAAERRREARKKAQELFELVDEDGGGTLDEDEVRNLASKLVRMFKGEIDLDPPFRFESDWPLMDQVCAPLRAPQRSTARAERRCILRSDGNAVAAAAHCDASSVCAPSCVVGVGGVPAE